MTFTDEQAKALREPFDPNEVGKLPRVTCARCRESSGKVCTEHNKSRCSVCNNYITNAHLHLDYVGHAELTDRLLAVDPLWSWEPMGRTPEGAPVVERHGGNLVMWGNLTLCGVTRPGVGTAPANKDDAHKELIGDFLRNAAMRFGVALDLWRKSEKVDREHPEPEAPASLPCRWCDFTAPADDREPMRAHLVDKHGFERQGDGSVVAPPKDDAPFDLAEPVATGGRA